MRSFVDLCLFVRFIELTGERAGEKEVTTTDEMLALWVEHEASMPPYVFHELYHFWQGLRLPFVYRYASRTLKEFPLTVQWLRESGLDLRSSPVQTESAPADYGRIWTAAPLNGIPKRLKAIYGHLSPLDLLEGAASLAEFQMQHEEGARTSLVALQRWAKRNPSYMAAFEVMSRRLRNAEFALRMALPIMCQAFFTSDPVRSFAGLVEMARPIGSSYGEKAASPPSLWSELVRSMLLELPFDAEPDAESGYCRLLPRQFYIAPDHPISGRLARAWEETTWPEAKADPQYELVLEMPGWIDDEVLSDCRDRFGPPFTVVRFHGAQGRRDIRIVAGENADAGALAEDLLPELLTAYGLLRRRTGLHYDERTRLCHHAHCRFYEANWCNTFPFVPPGPEECTFPAYVERLIELVRVDRSTH